MRKQFRDTILDLAQSDESIVLLFGDVSVYLFQEYQRLYPKRFLNLGICENTIIAVAAGLAAQGFTPFAHTIAPFLTERSFEQIKLDLCYNRFAVNLVTCGASFDYAWDGASHHCLTDLAILRLLPGMEVLQPGSVRELDLLLRERYRSGAPTYFRLSDHPHDLDVVAGYGRGAVVRDAGAELTVMTAGPILGNVVAACEGLDVNIVSFSSIKPLDHALVSRFARTRILVVHDAFGLHEAVCEVPGVRTAYHGLSDDFISCYGRLENAREHLGLDAAGIRARVRRELDAAAAG